MAGQPPIAKLTFSLIKDAVGRDGVLQSPDLVVPHIVSALDASRPSLFIGTSVPHAPRWQAYLEPHVTSDLQGLYAASSSAVLLVEASDRLVAVTFGQGRHLLSGEALVQDFGLKVVLNTVAPDQLKSVDAKTIEETTLHTRRDVSRDSSFAAFGLDVTRDLVRAVTGTPRDTALGHRLTGSDALGLWTRAQIPELVELTERLLDAYEGDQYRENFDFVDHLRPEKRPDRLRELEAGLVKALQTGELDNIHLAAPETIDWLEVAGFRFSTEKPSSELQSDPHVSAYLDSRSGKDIDLKLLRRDRLVAARASGDDPLASWPILRCLVYEVKHDGDLYVLSGGDWFRVNLEFRERVEQFVRGLDVYNGLPDAEIGTDEDRYNRTAAEALGGVCLDKKFVYDSGPDKMEVCDVFTPMAGFIHVKQRGSSSTLSHLFAQGMNSAERLLQDPEFRRQARMCIAEQDPSLEALIPEGRPEARSHEVTFAVVTRSTRDTPLTLPFFSLVSLRAAATRLQAFGFRVSVAEVHERAV